MARRLILTSGVIAVVMALEVPGSSAAIQSVGIKPSPYPGQFSPQTITVALGDTVRWVNTAKAIHHTTTADAPFDLWDSGDLAPGQHFDFTMFAGGTFNYHDALHTSMTGSIQVAISVQPSSGPIGTVFTITFDTEAPPPGFVYDVQGKAAGGSWNVVVRGTTATTATANTGSGPAGYVAVPVSGPRSGRVRVRRALVSGRECPGDVASDSEPAGRMSNAEIWADQRG